MKSLNSLLTIVLLLTLSSSCNQSGPLFEKYLKTKNSTWDRFDQKYFDIPVENTSKGVDITLIIRNTNKFVYDQLPLYVILATPDKEERVRELSISIVDNGKMTGKPLNNTFENRIELWSGLHVKGKGMYRISIESLVPKTQTEGIDEIGIVVTRSK